MPHNVYFVGSVALPDAASVFETASAVIGPALKRIPDGETGDRKSWIGWLEPVFANSPALELSDDVWSVHAAASKHRRYRLKPGASLADFRIDTLPYAAYAKESYAVFKRLRDAGKVAPGTRFQVDFAPAHSAARSHVVSELLPAIEPIYNAAIGREIDRIAAAIPHRDLAMQFDLASAVFEVLQTGKFGHHGRNKEEAAAGFAEKIATLANRVPRDIDLLFHFCYGDNNHRHSVEPIDMADMVDMANRLTKLVTRPIQLIHMPVPRDRSDDAYFAPLKNLAVAPDTEICLGLVHHTGGIEGVKKRLATARKYLKNFAIGTECGMGRRDPATIPELLKIHREASLCD